MCKIILWLITIIGGSILSAIIPSQFRYSLGVIVGCLIIKEIEWIVKGE